VSASEQTPVDPEPQDWPVLVTGAGGFVGGHIARQLAGAGHRVRGLVRGTPAILPGDPEIEWLEGDLREPAVRRQAVAGVLAVIHSAAWVSLGRDPKGLSQSINVDATRRLLDDARQAGARRFILSSTIHTVAAGLPHAPADETSEWNLSCVDSPYARSKRTIETHVRDASLDAFTTVVLCVGMVIGPRDPKPTSTRLLRTLAGSRVAFLPRGGIPIVDAAVMAQAHRRALVLGDPGERYAVVGPYLSYLDLARLVADVTGRPRVIIPLPAILRRPLQAAAILVDLVHPRGELSATTVAGGFLSLHVSGRRADDCFGLEHPSALQTIRSALNVE
jgi:dihydroflavonol-4-reductase